MFGFTILNRFDDKTIHRNICCSSRTPSPEFSKSWSLSTSTGQIHWPYTLITITQPDAKQNTRTGCLSRTFHYSYLNQHVFPMCQNDCQQFKAIFTSILLFPFLLQQHLFWISQLHCNENLVSGTSINCTLQVCLLTRQNSWSSASHNKVLRLPQTNTDWHDNFNKILVYAHKYCHVLIILPT